jgi:hypothetical protein
MLKLVWNNWRTTCAGLAAVFTALADIFTQLKSGHIDGSRIQADVAAIMAGVGLIFAHDVKNGSKS